MPGGQEAHTAQPAARPPCQCDQQLGDALTWLAVALAIIMVLDRWRVWRRKRKDKKPDGTAGSGAEDEGRSK